MKSTEAQVEAFHPQHPGQSSLDAALEPPLKSKDLAEAKVKQLKANFLSLMDEYGLDVLMFPPAGWAPEAAALADLPVVNYIM